jgi:hypothetical protein
MHVLPAGRSLAPDEVPFAEYAARVAPGEVPSRRTLRDRSG